MRVPNPSPVLDKNRASMGPEILSSTGAGVWRKAPKRFPGSSSVLDKFQSARKLRAPHTIGFEMPAIVGEEPAQFKSRYV